VLEVSGYGGVSQPMAWAGAGQASRRFSGTAAAVRAGAA
jgi:hypothetical protein